MNLSDANDDPALPAPQTLLQMLENLALRIPRSEEPPSDNPNLRAAEIIRVAGFKAGALSATLALPPGPLGLITVIPDLLQVWQLQQQMVADVAACFGKSAQLNRQMMVYCLFRHGAAMLVRDVVARVGERVIVKQASLRVIQQTLQKIGVHVSQKAVGTTLSRWLPIVGPVLIGGYSLLDTRKVGKTAIDTFSRQIEIDPPANDALTGGTGSLGIQGQGVLLSGPEQNRTETVQNRTGRRNKTGFLSFAAAIGWRPVF